MLMLTDLLRGWVTENEERTKAFLGDRNYIGMSDVGKSFGCLRAAVAGKVRKAAYYPSIEELLSLDENDPKDFERIRQIIIGIRPLERGHEQEYGLAAAFRGIKQNYLEQLEIRVEHEGVPIHAHLDFTLFAKNRVYVAESKSNEKIPDVLYDEYEGQLFGQMGLLQRHWSDSVFSVMDEQGKYIVEDVTLPQVAKHFFGMKLPRKQTKNWSVRGSVISMGMKEMRIFDNDGKGYTPNDLMTNVVLNKAVHIWKLANAVKKGFKDLNRIEYRKGFYPICDFCGHNYDCPKFTDATAMPELNSTIGRIKQLQVIKKKAEDDIKELQGDLKDAFDFQDTDTRDYIVTGDWRFRHARHTKETLKADLIKANLMEAGFSEEDADAFIEKSKTESEYRRLYISKYNAPKKKVA